jgi:hypothetical protein
VETSRGSSCHRPRSAPVKAAVTAQIAVAIAILTEASVRAANLAAIRVDENLIKPGGPDTPYLLVFPYYDVKNRVDLTFEFDDYLTDLIDEYVQEYRPSLLRGANGDYLFPGTTGESKDLICLASRSPSGSRRRPD